MATVGASNKTTRQYVDPVRTNNYQDPLKRKLERYQGNIKVPEFKPYTSYHEYKMPDIDPLTGKPRRKRKPRPQPEPAPKPAQKPQPVKLKEPTPEPEPEPTPTPTPSPSPEPDNFTQEFGNTVGSIKRSMGFMFKMDISSPSTLQW